MINVITQMIVMAVLRVSGCRNSTNSRIPTVINMSRDNTFTYYLPVEIDDGLTEDGINKILAEVKSAANLAAMKYGSLAYINDYERAWDISDWYVGGI